MSAKLHALLTRSRVKYPGWKGVVIRTSACGTAQPRSVEREGRGLTSAMCFWKSLSGPSLLSETCIYALRTAAKQQIQATHNELVALRFEPLAQAELGSG